MKGLQVTIVGPALSPADCPSAIFLPLPLHMRMRMRMRILTAASSVWLISVGPRYRGILKDSTLRFQAVGEDAASAAFADDHIIRLKHLP
jgi:hypothetical protein